jgi:hypothetical protein
VCEHELQLMQFYEGLKLNLQDQNEKDFFQFLVAISILLLLHLTIVTILSINAPQGFIIGLTVLLEKVKNSKVEILSTLANFAD